MATDPKKPNVKSTKTVPAGFKKVGPAVSQKAKNFMKGTTGPNKITPPSKTKSGGLKMGSAAPKTGGAASTTKTSGKQPIATGKTPKIEYNYGNQMSTRDSALFAPKVNAYAKANPNTPKFTMTNTEGKGIQYEKQYVGKGKDGKTYKVTASNQKNAGKKYGVTKWTESTPKQITVSRKTK